MRDNHSGFILTELIIAVALGLLVLSLLLEIFIVSERVYQQQIALNQIQTNANTAIEILTTDIHKAGYIGCPKLTQDFPITAYPPFSITPKNKITGDTNELMIRHASYPNVILKKSMQDHSTLYASNETQFKRGTILIISDCTKAEIIRVANVSLSHGLQKITTSTPLKNTFSTYTEISRLEINKYFTAKTKRHTIALFVEDIKNRKTELVEGIDHMQLLYALDQEGRLIELPANQIHDWSSIIGVSMSLESSSPPFKKIWHLYANLG